MKRLNLLLCAVAIVALARPAVAANWFVGLIGGVNYADLTDVDETSMKAGFTGGGFIGADFSPGVSGRVEILYTQKGTSQHVNPEFGDQDTTIKLDYLEFPILLIFHATHSETSALNLYGGPSIGMNISSEVELEDGSAADYDDAIKPVDVGLIVGVGFEHIRESLTIFFDGRVNIGLTGVLENAASEYEGVKNLGLGFLVGLKFPLGAKG